LISFFFHEIPSFPLSRVKLRNGLKKVITSEGKQVGVINFIFCNDEYLYNMNLQYLQHDYYTDVITFDYCVHSGPVSGDVFISVDRVGDNVKDLGCTFVQELHRVMIHGVLHLCGYGDSTPDARAAMEVKENYYLPLLA